MGKVGPSPRVQVRVSQADYEMLHDLAEEGGTTLSEIVRQWVSTQCRIARNQQANLRAVTMMEGFLGTVGAQMVERGELGAVEAVFGMRKGEFSESDPQDLSSNTGPKRPVLATLHPKASPRKGKKS